MAGQIVRRGDNKFLVRVFLGRDEQTGKRNYFNKTIRGTKKDAQRFLNGMLREIDLGTFMEPSSMTLNAFLDKWLNAIKSKVREGTHRGYTYALSCHIRPAFGTKTLARLKQLDIQGLYSELLTRGLTANSVLHTHAVLSMSLKQACKWGMIKVNPCTLVELPQLKRKETNALSPEETSQFLAALEGDDYRPVLMLALLTGMRPNELFGLKWSDVDLNAGLVRVQRTMQRKNGGGWEFGETKTASAKRTITLPASLTRVMTAHRREQIEYRLRRGAEYETNDLVFASSNGGPLDHNHTRIRFREVLERAKLPTTFRLYDLRHSCATLLLAAGENPKVVSERLGHANVALTLNVYSHVLPSMQQSAAEKLEKLCFSGAGTP